MPEQINVHIRWMIRRDMAEVLEIENDSFEYPWTERDFLQALRQRNCIGMVAERDEQVVGFMVYMLHEDRLEVLDIAVAADFRRQGVGKQMADKLKGKLSRYGRSQIVTPVRETNMDAVGFFSSQGFHAKLLRGFYLDATPPTNEDAFEFRFLHGAKSADPEVSHA